MTWRRWGTLDPEWRRRGDDVDWYRSRGLTYREIGQKMGITRSRAWEIHRRQKHLYARSFSVLMRRVGREQ